MLFLNLGTGMQVGRCSQGLAHLPGYLLLKEPSNIADHKLLFSVVHSKPTAAHSDLNKVEVIESGWASLLFYWCSRGVRRVPP